MTTWVWVDGTVTGASEARVSATDRGLLLGDGVFETCKVVEGTPFALTRHLARLRRSAALVDMELPWDDDYIRSACAEAMSAALGSSVDPVDDSTHGCSIADARDHPPGNGDPGSFRDTEASGVGGEEQVDGGQAGVHPVGRLRITVTGGPGPLGPSRRGGRPTLVVSAGPAPTRTPTADVVTAEWRSNEHSPSAGAKTTSHLDHVLGLAQAHRRGADEAVSANTAGALTEGTGSNVFVVVDGALCTPSLSTGCLQGVTRDLVLEQVPVVSRDDLTLDDLRRAPEAFLTSSLRDVHPIARVDGRALAAAPGALTEAAAGALAAVQAATMDP